MFQLNSKPSFRETQEKNHIMGKSGIPFLADHLLRQQRK